MWVWCIGLQLHAWDESVLEVLGRRFIEFVRVDRGTRYNSCFEFDRMHLEAEG